jgi:hypothetical protein
MKRPSRYWPAIAVALWIGPSVVAADASIDAGDQAWVARAGTTTGAIVDPAPVTRAIAAYTDAVAAAPDALDPHWKLLRALWFRSEFASRDPGSRRRDLADARTVAQRAGEVVGRRLGAGTPLDLIDPARLSASVSPVDAPAVARICFWSAITLGAWARDGGLLQAVRAGAANALHRRAECALALDPAVDDGGALRLLSRLHAELPRVPLLSGWVDRAQALPLAERAFALRPAHPGNAYVLALALLDAGPGRRSDALQHLQAASTAIVRPDEAVEDEAIRRDAAARLATETSK